MDLAGGSSVFPCSLIYLRMLLKGTFADVVSTQTWMIPPLFLLECSEPYQLIVAIKLFVVLSLFWNNKPNSEVLKYIYCTGNSVQ